MNAESTPVLLCARHAKSLYWEECESEEHARAIAAEKGWRTLCLDEGKHPNIAPTAEDVIAMMNHADVPTPERGELCFSDEAKAELDELLRAWVLKQVTAKGWLCTAGKPRWVDLPQVVELTSS